MAKTKRKKRRSPAQKRATAKMLRANKRSRRGNPKRGNPKRKRRTVARKKRRGGRRRGGGGGNPGIATARDKAFLTAGATGYGYLDTQVEMFDKLPKIPAIGRHFSNGIFLHVVARNTSGLVRKWADLFSVGALSIGGYTLGANNFDFAAAVAQMQGEGVGHGDSELSGDIEIEGDDE